MNHVECASCPWTGPHLTALLDHAREAHRREPGVEYSPYVWPHIHAERDPEANRRKLELKWGLSISPAEYRAFLRKKVSA